MKATAIHEAISAWRQVLGEEHVWDSDDQLAKVSRNASGLKRQVPAVIRPASTDEVAECVRAAGKFRQCIYPFSRGQNWGLGSRLPVRDGCVLMDLSRMNRIHEVSQEGAYAVIEPGVTQRELHEHLKSNDIPLIFNVTGSGAGSSVLGNAIDRGVGYLTTKAGSLSGQEIVLGTGEILRTGFAHYPDCLTTHLYRYGLGPSLDELFSQSNFGIITRAGIALHPRPCAAKVLVCRKRASVPLATFIEALIKAHRARILSAVIHVGNRHRAEAAMAPLAADYLRQKAPGSDQEQIATAVRAFLRKERFADWTAVGAILGEPAVVSAGTRLARRWLRDVAHLMIFDETRLRLAESLVGLLSFVPAAGRKRALLPSIRTHIELCQGIPSSEPLKSAYWAIGLLPPPGAVEVDPDHSVCGMMFVLPIIPMQGAAAQEAVDIVESAFRQAGFLPYVTLNLVDQRFMEAVINVAFRRDQADQVERAHALMSRLSRQFVEMGWYPYRLGVQEMDDFMTENDPFWQTARKLKAVFDPHHIIAPGRYNLV